jgi:ferric-dicitrate binding protein FerR (iron transport regulator)
MKHWTEHDFQHWLYGLKDEDSHVAQCAECRGELERLRQERRRVAAEPEISQDFLGAQRRSIYSRLDKPLGISVALRWVLSAATLLVVALGLTFERWHAPAQTISDEQLFSDLSAIEQTAEPQAIQPIHGLFEE